MSFGQLEIDISLTPKQQELYHAVEIHREGLFGGARGGGKSRGMRSVHIIRRIRYARSRGVIWRRTYPELEKNHIRPLFRELPQLREYYNEQKRLLSLPNGSTQEFCYAESERDLTKAQGTETDDLGLEEAGDWLEQEYEMLLATNRSAEPGIQPRAQCTANPGGRGHGWLKKRFITDSHPERFYIRSLVDDNPALLENDPNYLKVLDNIRSETLRRAWRYGDWDIAAGQYFSEFSRDVHVVRPFEIPGHWFRFGSYDYGFNHPSAWFSFACDEDGSVFVTREMVKARLSISEQAKAINQWPEIRKIPAFLAGRDCWATKKAGDPTIAEDFAKYKIILKAANTDRKLGASQIRNYLEYEQIDGKRIGPQVFIFDTCPILIDCITRMVHNPDDVEDVLKVDASEGDPYTGDDPYDSFRYGLMSRPIKTPKQKSPWADKYDRQKRTRPNAWTV